MSVIYEPMLSWMPPSSLGAYPDRLARSGGHCHVGTPGFGSQRRLGEPFPVFLLLVAGGKTGRYVVLAASMLGWI
jgi:hypothetical protein